MVFIITKHIDIKKEEIHTEDIMKMLIMKKIL